MCKVVIINIMDGLVWVELVPYILLILFVHPINCYTTPTFCSPYQLLYDPYLLLTLSIVIRPLSFLILSNVIAFYLQADLNVNIQDDSSTIYAVSSQYESTENMTIQCSTKVCSFGKQVVEKVEVGLHLLINFTSVEPYHWIVLRCVHSLMLNNFYLEMIVMSMIMINYPDH